MKIVVLDGYTLNPGDLSWDELSSMGECEIFDRTSAGQTIERAKNAEIVLTNKTVLDGKIINALDKLRYIGVLATGYNVVDIAAARERGILVANVPSYGTSSVAQMTFAIILELANRVGHHSETVRNGRWCKSKDFCYWDHPLVELEGLTIGIVGVGRIGQSVAKIAQGFGMKVLASSKSMKTPSFAGVTMTELDTVIRKSDIVSLHCPLTDDNKGFINTQRLSVMKPSAFLINTSRGLLIDEKALADALDSGIIAGAGLDVLSEEPPRQDNPLLSAKNCFITPHISWATYAARERLMRIAIANVQSFIEVKPKNIVNG